MRRGVISAAPLVPAEAQCRQWYPSMAAISPALLNPCGRGGFPAQDLIQLDPQFKGFTGTVSQHFHTIKVHFLWRVNLNPNPFPLSLKISCCCCLSLVRKQVPGRYLAVSQSAINRIFKCPYGRGKKQALWKWHMADADLFYSPTVDFKLVTDMGPKTH